MTECLETCRQKAINTQTHSDIFTTQTEEVDGDFNQNNDFQFTSVSLSHVHTHCSSSVPCGWVSWWWSVFSLLTGSRSTSSVSSINEWEEKKEKPQAGFQKQRRTLFSNTNTHMQTQRFMGRMHKHTMPSTFFPLSDLFKLIFITPSFCNI